MIVKTLEHSRTRDIDNKVLHILNKLCKKNVTSLIVDNLQHNKLTIILLHSKLNKERISKTTQFLQNFAS